MTFYAMAVMLMIRILYSSLVFTAIYINLVSSCCPLKLLHLSMQFSTLKKCLNKAKMVLLWILILKLQNINNF